MGRIENWQTVIDTKYFRPMLFGCSLLMLVFWQHITLQVKLTIPAFLDMNIFHRFLPTKCKWQVYWLFGIINHFCLLTFLQPFQKCIEAPVVFRHWCIVVNIFVWYTCNSYFPLYTLIITGTPHFHRVEIAVAKLTGHMYIVNGICRTWIWIADILNNLKAYVALVTMLPCCQKMKSREAILWQLWWQHKQTVNSWINALNCVHVNFVSIDSCSLSS